MAFLGNALDFERFNLASILEKLKSNPQRLLVGAVDPLGTKIANTALGTNWDPAVNQLGGATEQTFREAQDQGIDTGPGRSLHNAAGAIAASYALGGGSGWTGALNAAGSGLGAATQPGQPQQTSAPPQAPAQQRRGLDPRFTDLGLALLANSGYSATPRTFGQTLGASALQAQQMGQERQKEDLQAQYIQAQIAALNRKPGGTTPSSVAEYEYAKANGFKGTFEEWQLKSKGPNTPSDVLTYEYFSKLTPQQQADFLRTKRNVGSDFVVQDVNGVPTLIYKPGAGGPAMSGGTPLMTPLTDLASQAAGAASIAGAGAAGRGQGERTSGLIDAGLAAADATAITRRGIELLDSVSTGGFDAAKLKATNLFGVTGADEAELSANLGKAVLSQLRSTFGAQFTQQEGERLAGIEAGFGKSTEGNRRLLGQALKILDRAARRGLAAAESSGDKFTADEIRKALEFDLSTEKKPTSPTGWSIAPAQ